MVSGNWIPPLPLNGHIFSYGRTDAGKTWKLIAVIQFYHAHIHKIWDLWGGKRKEGGFWCFASDERKLWFDYKVMVGEMSKEGPKEYNVNLYYPLFLDNIPNELPNHSPRITAFPFTIYFKDVEINTISTVTGALSNKAQKVWETIKKELSDNATCEDILDWFEKKENTQYKRYTLYGSFIEPFCENRVLAGKNCEINLDLIKEAKDKNSIMVLSDDYTPEKFKMFFILHVMNKVYNYGENDVIHRKNIGFFRELNYFMKVQDESKQDNEQKQIMRNEFSNIARYGRSAFLIAGDTQSPAEVDGIVEGQDDLLLLNEMPGEKDREKVCDPLKRNGRMSLAQANYLGSIDMTQDEDGKPFKGKMVVVERGKRARLIKRVQPPRTKCFKRSDGNFMKVWKEKINKFVSIKDIKEKISDLNELRRLELKKERENKNKEEKEIIVVGEDSYQTKEDLEKEKYRKLKTEQLEKELMEDIII